MPSDNNQTPPYEYEIDHSPSITVIRAIAEIENSDPLDLEFTLYDVIDPEAFDKLCTSEDVQIYFEIDQYEVRIIGTETVQLWP